MVQSITKQHIGSGGKKSENKQYILIVDDETKIIRSLILELSPWAKTKGISITGAVIAQEALHFIENHKDQVKLVVADIRMPGMWGGDMITKIKQRYPHIKIIVLTGYDDGKEIMKAGKAGIISVIYKPWDKDHLVNEIEKAL